MMQSMTAWTMLLLAASHSAIAQQSAGEPAVQGIVAYTPRFFASASPVNALDMVLRLPGFSITEADADVRGYAAAQGNVLIDGTRPDSKRNDIVDLLKRIPAQSVERIELIRSGARGIDMAGHALVANVIRRQQVHAELGMEGGAIASTDGWLRPRGKLEYASRHEERGLDLAMEIEPELDDDSGQGVIRTYAPDATAIENSEWDTRTVVDNAEAAMLARQPFARGRLVASTTLRREMLRTDTTITGEEAERVQASEELREADIGLRHMSQIDHRSTLELMATQHLGWLDAIEDSREELEVEKFQESTRSGEGIVRIEYASAWSDALLLQASMEGAFNFLDSDTRLQTNGVAVEVPGSKVRIEERRGEAAAAAVWKPSNAWVLEVGMRVEVSTIAQTGDIVLERRFSYPKPRFATRWDCSERDQLRLSLSREIGQLDFQDFVASASLDTDTVSAGNAALEPDKTWRTILAWEHHVGEEAALTLTWTHDEITDVIDRVLIAGEDEVFDAPGNIGAGRRDTLALELGAPLDHFGVAGGHLRTSLLRRYSRVTDPVTGEQRPISEEKPVEGVIEFSQSLPSLRVNWGITLDHIAEEKTKYRYDRVERESEDMGWTVFLERHFGRHWRLRAEVTDLSGREFREERAVYEGPRDEAPLDDIERRRRTSPGYVSLTLRRSTG